MKKWISLFAFLIVAIFLSRSGGPPEPTPLAQVTAPAPAPMVVTPAPVVAVSDLRAWLAEPNRRLDEGLRLAQTRRETMLQLMATRPAEAIAQSLPWSEWAALPEPIRSLVERPFSQSVAYEVVPGCAPAQGLARRVKMDGEWHEAFVYGSKIQMGSKEPLFARGFELDGKVALAEMAIEHLAGADLEAARAIFPAANEPGISWVSHQPTGATGRTVLMAGALYDVASEAEANELSETLALAEKSLHPRAVEIAMNSGQPGAAFDAKSAKNSGVLASSTWTETSKSVLVLRIAYADNTAAAMSAAEITTLINNTSNAVKVMSYGKTWLMPTQRNITLPQTYATYFAGDSGLIEQDAQSVLRSQGISPESFDIIIYAHPAHAFVYAGRARVGGQANWLNGRVSLEVIVHEIGHNYGLLHSNYRDMLTGVGAIGHLLPDGSEAEFEEYGDNFDVMGANLGALIPAGQYSAHGKVALNWIEAKEVINVFTNGIYRIYRYDHKDARTNANAKLALKVSAGGEEYWVSHRKLFTGNATMGKGANIHLAEGFSQQSLVDATPLSRASQSYSAERDDSALVVGKSFTDTLGTVRLTTLASAGAAPLEYIDVEVAFLDTGAYSLYTGADFKTNGLVGSYVNLDLRSRTQQDDWRSTVTIAGRRIDPNVSFTGNSWGQRSRVGLNGGTDLNWDNFSVQWDGYIVVRRPLRLATMSDDSSRFWIDLNNNNTFSTTAPEYVNNHWGTGQGATVGDLSGLLPPGTYRIRIQYEEGNGDNSFGLVGYDVPFKFFTTAAATTPGLTASFVARDLRTATIPADWRTSQTIAGSRVDPYPGYTHSGWGNLADVGLVPSVNGVNTDWENFSVQWDGFISNSVPIKMATVSDDYSRMWIDVNTNGVFANSSPELINNGWGGASGQSFTQGAISTVIQPGMYALRIQYHEINSGNQFLLRVAPQPPADPTQLYATLFFAGGDARTATRTIAGDFTILFWMKSSQVVGGEDRWTDGIGLVDASAPGPANDFGLGLGNGKILFGVGGASPVTIRSDFVADDQWHHVGAKRVQSSGELILYVDGIEVARGLGGTELLDAATTLTVGAYSDLTGSFIGTMDQVKVSPTARAADQIIAEFHTVRATHGFVDAAPSIRIGRVQANSYQLYWDALSSYRILEGATSITGPFTTLATDQNSTNLTFGSTPVRYFRVRK